MKGSIKIIQQALELNQEIPFFVVNRIIFHDDLGFNFIINPIVSPTESYCQA